MRMTRDVIDMCCGREDNPLPGGELHLLVNRWHRFAKALVLFIICVASAVVAKEQSASVNASVAAGETYITRLRNLPRGAFVSVVVEIDGAAKIMLLDEQNVQRSPAERKPLFSAINGVRQSRNQWGQSRLRPGKAA